MSFSTLGLSDAILQAVTEEGYTTPTPVQAQAIPAILEGRDVMAAAQTGTGKTAGFTLPILELLSRGHPAKNNQVRTLILTPTRELAAQVGESVATYGKHLRLKSNIVFGGVKINPQMMRLRQGADILIATPGRLLDLYQQNAINFKTLEILVLDEADRMLDMGFIHDIRRIIAALPKQRQNLMFSATFSDEIRTLAKGIIHNPLEISVTPRNAAAKSVKQWICPVDKRRKGELLRHLINENNWQQVLVFSRTKHGANKLSNFLDASGIKATAIHGNKSQNARTKALADFKQGKVRILVATDIAARGLDIDELPVVVNHDLPNVPEDYVHRIGRTGRAGSTGEAVSIVSADELDQLRDIEKLTGALLEREYIGGYEPTHDLPITTLSAKPNKPKKPKKPRQPHSPAHATGQANSRSSDGRSAAAKGANSRNTPPKPAGKRPPQTAKPGAQKKQNTGATPAGNKGPWQKRTKPKAAPKA